MRELKIAIIGLDTSHSVVLPQMMQDPSLPESGQITGLRVVRAMRFPSPFQSEDGQDERQQYLESIGVSVGTNFAETVKDCDGLMLEINDPSAHLKYFEMAAKTGLPVFLDKPLADNFSNAKKIIELRDKYKTRLFTASSLRFDVDFQLLLAQGVSPKTAVVWGPLGCAAAGSDIIWYGCHTFELLEAILGTGAVAITGSKDAKGFTFHVAYEDERRGIVDLTRDCPRYGALVRDDKGKEKMISVTGRIPYYRMLLEQINNFFNGKQPVDLKDSIEVMALTHAANQSILSGTTMPVSRI